MPLCLITHTVCMSHVQLPLHCLTADLRSAAGMLLWSWPHVPIVAVDLWRKWAGPRAAGGPAGLLGWLVHNPGMVLHINRQLAIAAMLRGHVQLAFGPSHLARLITVAFNNAIEDYDLRVAAAVLLLLQGPLVYLWYSQMGLATPLLHAVANCGVALATRALLARFRARQGGPASMPVGQQRAKQD